MVSYNESGHILRTLIDTLIDFTKIECTFQQYRQEIEVCKHGCRFLDYYHVENGRPMINGPSAKAVDRELGLTTF